LWAWSAAASTKPARWSTPALQDGSRVNAIIPPAALDGPAMSIRRFGSKPMQVEDLIRHGAFPQA
jgi:Flp pilus assembly CpaF family ATPase